MKAHVSFSEIWLWSRDKEAYRRRYIEGLEDAPTREMGLGTIVHHALESPTFRWERALEAAGEKEKIPIVVKVIGKMAKHRLGNPEAWITAKTRSGLKLVAKYDDCDLKHGLLNEYKTYESERYTRERWTPSIVHYHKGITFYNWVYFLSRRRFFRENRLFAIDLSTGNVRRFETSRGIHDIKHIEAWVEKAVREIREAGLWELRLSQKDRKLKATPTLFAEEKV